MTFCRPVLFSTFCPRAPLQQLSPGAALEDCCLAGLHTLGFGRFTSQQEFTSGCTHVVDLMQERRRHRLHALEKRPEAVFGGLDRWNGVDHLN